MEASHANTGARLIWAALDARMRELYVAQYQVEQGFPEPLSAESLVSPNQLTGPASVGTASTVLLTGNGWQTDYGFSEEWTAHLALQPPLLTLPRAIWSAELALALLQRDESVKVAPELALPVYLRDKVTWVNKPKVGE